MPIIKIPLNDLGSLKKLGNNIFSLSPTLAKILQKIREKGLDEKLFVDAIRNTGSVPLDSIEYQLAYTIKEFLNRLSDPKLIFFYKLIMKGEYHKVAELKLFFESIAKYGVTFPMIWSAPSIVIMDITTRCNLYCYSSSSSKGFRGPSTFSILKFIDDLKTAGGTSIIFSGGEPLLREDIYDLIEYASERGLDVKISTNGTLIDEDTVKKLVKAGLRKVLVSLDGLRPETHEAIRGKGTFEKVLKAIKLLKKAKMGVVVEYTMNTINISDITNLELLKKFAKEYNVNILLYDFIPSGRGIIHRNLELSPKQKYEALIKIHKHIQEFRRVAPFVSILSIYTPLAAVFPYTSLYKETFVHQTNWFAGLYGSMIFGEKGTKAIWNSIVFGGCWAGRYYMGIDVTGRAKPCPFAIPTGDLPNVYNEGLDKAWNNDVFMKIKLREYKGSCSSCPFLYVCGGCRARVIAHTRSYLDSDPHCILKLGKINKNIVITPIELLNKLIDTEKYVINHPKELIS